MEHSQFGIQRRVYKFESPVRYKCVAGVRGFYFRCHLLYQYHYVGVAMDSNRPTNPEKHPEEPEKMRVRMWAPTFVGR